ncbi:MAG: MATE family efflux transporter [Faecousia sp.]
MRDMTTGSPFTHLWRYALPLLLGNWVQLSYNAVDSIIAGRFIGAQALAAEGIAGPVMNLVILSITGLCIGAGVLMSEAFGARDYPRLGKALSTTLLFGSIVCCVVSILGILTAPWILQAMAVPGEIRQITCVYLRITFLGTPFTFVYNALAAGLKSVGDSKTPFLFLAFSAVLNAVLDLIFLGLLGFGVLCSAATTVVAEAVSALLATAYMVKKVPQLTPKRGQWRIDGALLRQVLRYGGPTAFQQAIQPIGKLVIQGQVNALGVNVIAAFNAVTRMDDFACIPEQGISSAISTYIAQNRGAGKKERIRPGFRAGIRMECGYWLLIGTITALLRTPIVSMFITGGESAEVIRFGSQYLGWMALFYLLPAMTNGVQGFFRGMGKMYTTMVGTFAQISVRAVFTILLAPRVGITGIAFASAVGWSVMLMFEVPYYFITCRKQNLDKKEKP